MVSVIIVILFGFVLLFLSFILFRANLMNVKFIYGLILMVLSAIVISFSFTNIEDLTLIIIIGIVTISVFSFLGIVSPITIEETLKGERTDE
ncbi:MAG: hypothetical protein ACTSQE_02915 [Candidatus Heimdallarchaeaceae archaeon]